MVHAYVLLQTEVGSVEEILDAVTADRDVAWAEPVTGPYDVIAAFRESPPQVLDRLDLKGVIRTVTCPTTQP